MKVAGQEEAPPARQPQQTVQQVAQKTNVKHQAGDKAVVAWKENKEMTNNVEINPIDSPETKHEAMDTGEDG